MVWSARWLGHVHVQADLLYAGQCNVSKVVPRGRSLDIYRYVYIGRRAGSHGCTCMKRSTVCVYTDLGLHVCNLFVTIVCNLELQLKIKISFIKLFAFVCHLYVAI